MTRSGQGALTSRPIPSITPEIGDHVVVTEWRHREPLEPLDGWVTYISDTAITISATQDDAGLSDYDTDWYTRASFPRSAVTIARVV